MPPTLRNYSDSLYKIDERYPATNIRSWCEANKLDSKCCPWAVTRVYKHQLGWFPSQDEKRDWKHDTRPAIEPRRTCVVAGNRLPCTKTIEVDEKAKKLVEQHITECEVKPNKSSCARLGLGHCCNDITSTSTMSPAQIVEATLDCTRAAYPCELIHAADRVNSTIDLSDVHTRCSQVSKERAELAARTTSLCQEKVNDWRGGNKQAYNCCIQAGVSYATSHKRLIPVSRIRSTCQIKGDLELEYDRAVNWVSSTF